MGRGGHSGIAFFDTSAEVDKDHSRHLRRIADAVDGFILGSHVSPSGLDEVVDRVVPLLQERGVFRTEYTGTTLRENLGLPFVENRHTLARRARQPVAV